MIYILASASWKVIPQGKCFFSFAEDGTELDTKGAWRVMVVGVTTSLTCGLVQAEAGNRDRESPLPHQCSPIPWATDYGFAMLQFGCRLRCAPSLVSLLLVGLAVASSDLFDVQQGDINFCKKKCQIAVKNKSTSKDSILNACHRGCLLFSICQFVNSNADFNTSREECHGACREAYSRPVEEDSCIMGCGSQPLEAESRRRRVKALAHQPHPFSVLDTVSSWCTDIISSAQSFISSTWTFYLQADDGKLVVFQSQPEIEYTLPELQAPRSDVADRTRPPADSHTPRPHSGVRARGGKNAARLGGKGKQVGQRVDQPGPEHDFLGCMSRRSGMPRWILAACLFLSIIVMLWLSCASLVTAPDQHIKAQLSINGDKDFLGDVHKVTPYPLNPVIALAINESDEEAGPLPVKVDLNKSII